MSKALIIARKDAREVFRSKSTYLYVILLGSLYAPYFAGFNSVIGSLVKQGATPAELRLASQSFLTGVAYTVPLLLTMLICSVFASYSVVMDKAKRTLESLLSTPLSLRQLWLGKSLGVALPGIAIALFVSLLVLLAMNLVLVVPTVGSFIVPGVLSLVTGFVIVPAMAFFLVSLVALLQLIMVNPRIANFAFIGIFLGIYMATITEFAASWDFSLIYLVATVFIAVITLFLTRFLTKERVVLSSKG